MIFTAKIDVTKIEGYASMTPEEKIAALENLEYDDGAEQANELDTMRTELNRLKRDNLIFAHKAELLAVGYDEALAAETAAALADGDTAKVFANQKKFLDLHDKKFKADLLKDTPKPPPGSGSDSQDYGKLAAESLANGDFAQAAYYTRLQNDSQRTGD